MPFLHVARFLPQSCGDDEAGPAQQFGEVVERAQVLVVLDVAAEHQVAAGG